MVSCLIRTPKPEDIDCIARLWHGAFGDPPARIAALLSSDTVLRNAVAAEFDGSIRAVMLSFPGLHLANQQAAYLYGLCTQEEYRGKGLATSVLRALTERCFSDGAEFVFLCPADDGLRHWYQNNFSMKPMLSFSDLPLTYSPAAPVPCRSVIYEDYVASRHAFCSLTPELFSAQLLMAQEEECGFFRLELPDGPGVACVQRTDDALLILELLCSPASKNAALETLRSRFSVSRLYLRTAHKNGKPLLAFSRSGKEIRFPANGCFPFVMA